MGSLWPRYIWCKLEIFNSAKKYFTPLRNIWYDLKTFLRSWYYSRPYNQSMDIQVCISEFAYCPDFSFIIHQVVNITCCPIWIILICLLHGSQRKVITGDEQTLTVSSSCQWWQWWYNCLSLLLQYVCYQLMWIHMLFYELNYK